MFDKLASLISDHSDDAVEFGDASCDLSPTDERVAETEELLGCKLPISYLWFVRNYGGGEVYGEEIYSIYPVLSEKSVGDIVYQTRWWREKGLVERTDIVVSSNDFGEVFYMDTSKKNADGEYPVCVKAGKIVQKYANRFDEFLSKRIENPNG
ncbi:SMI1/KNR4 family protein [uncultured Tateyamaria sp.]|uniref:SMI1/KNR4 family protein n=1 Tax=uncultured Tateyamaria sp. TaxID=455651 RepID=UPI00261A8647|nr:SMI1/KNR4 family protein [uncultured Tateyamaria sp.]